MNDSPLPTSPSAMMKGFRTLSTLMGMPAEVFAQVVDNLTVAICIADPQARILYANHAFTCVTGYTLDDVIGQNAAILSHKSTPKVVYEQMWSRLRQQKSWTGQLVNRRKNGIVYLAELTVVPLVNERDETTYYIGMHRDVTDVHQLEQRVRNQKALIESMIDAAPVAIALLDAQSKVILDNHAYKKLFGDLHGKEPAVELLRALQDGFDGPPDQGYRIDHGFENKEISFEMGNGQIRWFTFSGTWFRERDDRADAFFRPVKQTYLLLMASEITHLKRHQEAVSMNALRALMAEQDRLRALRDALEAVIFQMQAPLNLVGAARDMLDRRCHGLGDHTALQEALHQALLSGYAALDRLRNALPADPPEAVAPVNINQLLREVLTLCTQRLLASGVVVEWKPALRLPAVPGRAGRLRSMFKQLVDNALDAMESHRGRERELFITTVVQDGLVVITVQDTGPGIPVALRLKVFEPFFSNKTNRTGMGLVMVQDVVNEHRGLISIDPAVTDGCRINVMLPIRGHSGLST